MLRNDIKIVSVFINEVMFRNFFDTNTCLLGYDLHGVDNRTTKLGLPSIYNSYIEKFLEQDVWLFFVHEDFEIKESLDIIFELDHKVIYGTFGVRMDSPPPIGFGSHTCSNKDGSNAVKVGVPLSMPELVQSLDCQSILLHTSLLREFPELRFDENLTFDLYAEDLCLRGGCELGIPIKVFPLIFQHYSHGKITERYHKGLAYLGNKYPNHAIPGSCSFVGGRSKELSKVFTYDIEAAR
ncbi:hypothetical protein [Pseudomonas sp.]|uniref:hypothetical protein n=1 Tax=Pseudomonas sp. TaxID=306 RepID=UPI00290FDA11|nr:hypothetical protein [Pseudomonas sp.]MDU4249505.1 hypothetical protein [Pseudomonas sp.]